MIRLIALTALVAATFFSTATPTHAINRMPDRAMRQHAHSRTWHQPRRVAGQRLDTMDELSSTVAAYLRGRLHNTASVPLTSGIVRVL